jgi:hypothetical protein
LSKFQVCMSKKKTKKTQEGQIISKISKVGRFYGHNSKNTCFGLKKTINMLTNSTCIISPPKISKFINIKVNSIKFFFVYLFL